ncbi:MAG TPA: M23 family metallopeptidase [Anaerolineaceae bacterium]|nr:M23 family metallopeptidase [Anaerolineaceae bacterium]
MIRLIIRAFSLVLLVVLVVSGCSLPAGDTTLQTPVATKTAGQFTATPPPTITPSSIPSPTPTATLQPSGVICSPLSGIELGDLHKITSQGYTPPAPYKDDGHPAVDLAFFTFKEMPSMIGHPVQSILPGKVSLVIDNQYPYGNAVMIETPLDLITLDLVNSLSLPTPIPQENLELLRPCDSDPAFESMVPLKWSDDSKSVFVLYAHLLEKPDLKVGETISCGQEIGAVGNTGNSAAEHLHLETRIGPAGARFGTLAMYAPEASVEERYSYCIWTTSGRFQSFNPVNLWEQEQ